MRPHPFSAARTVLHKGTVLMLFVASVLIGAACISEGRRSAPNGQVPQRDPLKLVQTIPLPDVAGRIDHLSCDVRNRRLFVAALGNNTLEVIDLKAGRRAHTIRGLQEPQGVAYMAVQERIYVANGRSDGVDIFDGNTYDKIGTVKVGEDCDNLRIDPDRGDIVVGYGKGGLAFIQASTKGGAVVHQIPLMGHPESFQIDPKGQTVYVNVPSVQGVQVCKTDQQKPTALWPVLDASANFPMALDAEHRLLFVGCREPARLCVFDTDEGKMKASVRTVEDADDIFYDSALRRVYVIGGGGAVDVLEYMRRHSLRKLATVPTAAGARTGLFVPALHRLYVAVPHRGSQQAEIRVYETEP
jgi:DNA-binding beta-propeller fold protein YncE